MLLDKGQCYSLIRAPVSLAKRVVTQEMPFLGKVLNNVPNKPAGSGRSLANASGSYNVELRMLI